MSSQPTPDDNCCTQAEFAARQGWAKSYVTKLKQEGRLVMTEDGKRVLAAESLARIAETTGAPERASAPVVSTALQDLQAAEKRLDIARKQREEDTACGKLLATADVYARVADAAVTLRARLESWPDRLAPQIAAMGANEGRIRALLADHIEQALADLATRFTKLAELGPQEG